MLAELAAFADSHAAAYYQCAHGGAVFFLQLLQSLVNWPVAAVVLALLFRAPLADLINRSIKWSKDGAEFVPPKQQRPDPPPANPAAAAIEGEAARVESGPTGTVGPASAGDAAVVGTPHVAHAPQPVTDEQLIAQIRANPVQAKNALAELYSRWDFERLYSNIFGSQWGALLRLDSEGGRVTAADANRDVAEAMERVGNKGATFESWSRFLRQAQLIATEVSDDQEVYYVLTPRGRNFIQYIRSVYPDGPPPRHW